MGVLARVGPVGRAEDRHERRRRAPAPPRSRPTASRPSSRRSSGKAGRSSTRPTRNMLAPGLARDGAHAARPAHRDRARVRARERREPDRALRRRTPGSASSPRARATTTCARRSPTWASTTAGSRAPACGILQLGMIWPLEPEVVREFAAGLDEIVVVEEKRPFLERQVKEILYGDAGRAARRSASSDERGEPAAAGRGRARRRRDRARPRPAAAAHGVASRRSRARLRKLAECRARARCRCRWPRARRSSARAARTTARRRRPDGTLVGAGIGCHTMVLLNPEGTRRHHRHHADGRRGRAVDRHGAVHRRRPLRPEPRRRHLPPLRLARRPRRGRRRRERHLQALLQRRRRDDRRPGGRGPDRRSPSSRAGSRSRASSGSSSRPRTRAATRACRSSPIAEVRDRSAADGGPGGARRGRRASPS